MAEKYYEYKPTTKCNRCHYNDYLVHGLNFFFSTHGNEGRSLQGGDTQIHQGTL